MGKLVYVKCKKDKAHQPGHWSESKRIEYVTTYLSTGNFAETCRITGVPPQTVEQWKRAPWWKELVDKIHAEEDQRTDTKLTKIIDKALEKLMDSIENGEHVYDQKTGKIKRMPAKLRDVNNAFNTILDKRLLLRKQPTKIVEQQSTATQLTALANEFAKFVKKQQVPEMSFIEGETVVQNADGTYEIKDE